MKHFNDCTKKQKLERWENVVRVLQGLSRHERRKHWDMRFYGERTSCGTVACAAGHCEADPWFRRRGFKGRYADTLGEMILVDQDEEWFGSKVRGFFGFEGTEAIFHNETQRPVSKVIKECRAYIKKLKG